MTKHWTPILLVVSSVALAALIFYAVVKVLQAPEGSFASLSILILVGLGAFIGLMNFLSFSAHLIGITDARQPFGLPDGTVRAILTIAFIVLVGVLASFLLTHSSGRPPFVPQPIEVPALPLADATALQQRLAAEGLAVVVPVTPATANAPPTATLRFHARQDYRLADDVAKQILTMLSTILAAMIGFYFGARSDGGTANDQAERTRILAELDALAAQAPTAATIRAAAAAKVAADAAKASEVQKIVAALDAIEGKLADARAAAANAALPIERVRAARDDARAAAGRLATLDQDLQKI